MRSRIFPGGTHSYKHIIDHWQGLHSFVLLGFVFVMKRSKVFKHFKADFTLIKKLSIYFLFSLFIYLFSLFKVPRVIYYFILISLCNVFPILKMTNYSSGEIIGPRIFTPNWRVSAFTPPITCPTFYHSSTSPRERGNTIEISL